MGIELCGSKFEAGLSAAASAGTADACFPKEEYSLLFCLLKYF